MDTAASAKEHGDPIGAAATLTREGNDILGLCRQIYSHTPRSLEHSFPDHEAPKGYVANLERLLDVLRLYLELLLEFIGLSPKVAFAFRLHRAVSVPVLSVPALAYTVWTRVKFLTTDSIRKELTTITQESESGRSSSETQTAELSLTTCESCHLSQAVVKELVSKVELFCSTHDITESSVLLTRDELRTKVHDVTNWKAMSEWCNALTTDIEQLTEITDKLLTNWKSERAKERKRYEELENKMKALEDKDINEKCDGGNDIEALKTRNEKLLSELEKKKKDIAEMKKRICSREGEYKTLKLENERLKEGMESKTEDIDERTQKCEYCEEKKGLEDENRVLITELDQSRKEVQELTKKVQDYETSCKSIQEECFDLKTTSEIEKEKVKQLEEQIGGKISDINGIISKYEIEITKYSKKVEDLKKESETKQVTLSEQMKSLEIQKQKILKCQQNELALEEKLIDREKIIASFTGLQQDHRKLQAQLDKKSKKETMLKEKIIQLERQMNNLGEECEFLKYQLQRYDPTFKSTQRKGSINNLIDK